jgi:hypothetical protein
MIGDPNLLLMDEYSAALDGFVLFFFVHRFRRPVC